MMKYAQALLERIGKDDAPAWKACVGFDGYIDSIAHLMRQVGGNEGIPFDTMRSAGTYFVEKAGKSCCVEMAKYSTRMGGNAPLFSAALSGLNPDIDLIGCLGREEIHPVFRSLAEKVRVTTVGEPGKCIALEFSDGKIMLSENTDTRDLDYSALSCEPGILRILSECDLMVLLNWSEMLHMQDIWEGILQNVISDEKKQKVFFDLSDCSGRSREDILRMLKTLRAYAVRRETLLSLNENEAGVLCGVIGEESRDISGMARALQKDLGISVVSVHSVYASCAARSCGCTEEENLHIAHPSVSTGGGDHFNAGLAYAWMQDYPDGEMLTLANCFGSCFVRDGVTPSLERVKRCLEELVNGTNGSSH